MAVAVVVVVVGLSFLYSFGEGDGGFDIIEVVLRSTRIRRLVREVCLIFLCFEVLWQG